MGPLRVLRMFTANEVQETLCNHRDLHVLVIFLHLIRDVKLLNILNFFHGGGCCFVALIF